MYFIHGPPVFSILGSGKETVMAYWSPPASAASMLNATGGLAFKK